jgi:hypothetical protein
MDRELRLRITLESPPEWRSLWSARDTRLAALSPVFSRAERAPLSQVSPDRRDSTAMPHQP